jgi:hypothetical protein
MSYQCRGANLVKDDGDGWKVVKHCSSADACSKEIAEIEASIAVLGAVSPEVEEKEEKVKKRIASKGVKKVKKLKRKK